MTSRRLLPAAAREALFGIASDTGSLERNHVLAEDDLDLIATRRNAANRLGLAVHIALLRHPGQGWLDGDALPGALVAWLAEQVAVPSSSLSDYGLRDATRSSHRRLAIRHPTCAHSCRTSTWRRRSGLPRAPRSIPTTDAGS